MKPPSMPSRHAVKPPKPPVPVATDLALSIATPAADKLPLSYWDVWYALLAADRFEGDLNRLAIELRTLRGGMLGSDAAKRKLSHLRDLQHRLTKAGLDVSDILAALPPNLAKAERRRAYGRIIKHNQRSYELSEAMQTLPAEKFCNIALRELWAPFPVSPQPFYEQLRAKFNWRRCYEEDASWDLDYQADRALTIIGQIAAGQKRFNSFEALAGEMGSLAWQRIIRLADAAVKARKRDLADRVFQAALACEDGSHRDFLSKKHEQLLNGKWSPDPRK